MAIAGVDVIGLQATEVQRRIDVAGVPFMVLSHEVIDGTDMFGIEQPNNTIALVEVTSHEPSETQA